MQEKVKSNPETGKDNGSRLMRCSSETIADGEMEAVDLGETMCLDGVAYEEAVVSEGEMVAQTDELIETRLLRLGTPTLMAMEIDAKAEVETGMTIEDIMTQGHTSDMRRIAELTSVDDVVALQGIKLAQAIGEGDIGVVDAQA